MDPVQIFTDRFVAKKRTPFAFVFAEVRFRGAHFAIEHIFIVTRKAKFVGICLSVPPGFVRVVIVVEGIRMVEETILGAAVSIVTANAASLIKVSGGRVDRLFL